MKILLLIMTVVWSFFAWAQSPNQATQPLNSEELQLIKKRYESCVFDAGQVILVTSNLRDAMDVAPLACRKELLQAKKFLLDSAFKIDVIDQLVSSIEEGVKIDLASRLVEQLKSQKRSK